METEERRLKEVMAQLALPIKPEQEQLLLKYINLIIEGLSRQRLVGTRDSVEIIHKHIFDSLYPVTLNIFSPGEMLDLGTGAGLPGIPLKIMLSEQKIFFMDANRRKIVFLKKVCRELKLEQVVFLAGRAEEWARHPDYRERFQTVVCRAVADTAILAELALPLAKLGGEVFLYKGPRGENEAVAAKHALRLCGGEVKRIYHYRLPAGEKRTLVCLRKVENTPVIYPRKPGKPAKKPLN